MGQRALKNRSTRIQRGQPYCQFWKDITQLFLPTAKLAQERHTPWKVSSTQTQIPREESYPEVLKRFLIISKVTSLTVSNSWSGRVIFRFTMKLSVTCLRQKGQALQSERTPRIKKASLLKGWASGPSAPQQRFTVSCKGANRQECRLQLGWTTCHLGHTQFS